MWQLDLRDNGHNALVVRAQLCLCALRCGQVEKENIRTLAPRTNFPFEWTGIIERDVCIKSLCAARNVLGLDDDIPW